MLAFAKDITQTSPSHPEEANNPKLKEYMDYQRQLNHERLIYHALDHAKTYLQKTINDARGNETKVADYVKKAFPASHPFADGDTLMLMLRKLVNAHNATNNWYRLNHFYFAVVYDALERFVKIYNRMAQELPDKAADYKIAPRGVTLDFDDWVRLYFHDLDFLIGKPMDYVHFTFRRRNREIETFINAETAKGTSREAAVEAARKQFNIEPSAVKIILNNKMDHKDMELFYTSVENPIYEFLYDPNAAESLMDGESLIDHSYFLAYQLNGLSESEAETVVSEIEKLSKH